MSIEVVEFTLYEHWACPLVYGDESGLEECDLVSLRLWEANNDGLRCVDVLDNRRFGDPDCGGLTGTVCTFVFHKTG